MNESASRRGDWIQIHTGRPFWPLDPRPEDFALEDVAQGLAHLCRFGGQCRTFYSVAQHSVLVSEICAGRTPQGGEPRRLNALAGLLHDAAEAFIADVPRPVKQHLPAFREIEERLWRAVQRRWGLCDPDSGASLFDDDLLWRADDVALVTEKRDLFDVELRWGLEDTVEALPVTIDPLPPEEARALFLGRFEELART